MKGILSKFKRVFLLQENKKKIFFLCFTIICFFQLSIVAQNYTNNASFYVDEDGCLVKDSVVLGFADNFVDRELPTELKINSDTEYKMYLWADAIKLNSVSKDTFNITVSSLKNTIQNNRFAIPVRDSDTLVSDHEYQYNFVSGNQSDTISFMYHNKDVRYRVFYMLSTAASSDYINNKKHNLLFYPNPAKQVIHLSGDLIIRKVLIYSVKGKLIKVINNPEGAIDISALKSGNYLIRAKLNNNQTETIKFVKQLMQ